MILFSTILTPIAYKLIIQPLHQISPTSKLVGLFHATIISIIGLLSSIGFFGMLDSFILFGVALPIIQSYFYYDYIQASLAVEVDVEADGDDVSWMDRIFNLLKSSSKVRNPNGVKIHHLITVAYLSGFLILPAQRAILIFCLGEIPLMFRNLSSWIHQKNRRTLDTINWRNVSTQENIR